MQRSEVITLVIIVLVFVAIFTGWFFTPFYLEKKAYEREKAIEWLMENNPANNPAALFHQNELAELYDYRAYLMDKYDIDKSELVYTDNVITDRDLLLAKNPVVKFLLGYD